MEIDELATAFDEAYYREQNHDVDFSVIAPLEHFATVGWREGRDPSSRFSTEGYLSVYADVRHARMNPLLHYLRFGKAEGRAVVVPGDAGAFRFTLPEADLRLMGGAFDEDFYREQCPDLGDDLSPLEHYATTGWREGLDPCPGFSTQDYLAMHGDVRQAGLNPFLHYLRFGKAEGRATSSSRLAPETPGSEEVQALRPHFDRDFYLAQNPDIAARNIDPLVHFCSCGWREGRDPHPDFSVRYYLEANPDIAKAELNPYWHFIVAGRAEGRVCRHPGGYKANALKYLRPLEKTVRSWRKRPPDADILLRPGEVSARIAAVLAADRPELVIALGHDDYRVISGGIQLCIQREAEAAAGCGMAYLNVHPWQPLPRLAKRKDDPDPAMRIVLDGEDLGVCRMSSLIEAAGRLGEAPGRIHVVIHSLLGHMPEQVAGLVLSTGKRDCRLWLHDFFTLCPSFVLQRNTITYCGAPGADSNACGLCVYGRERPDHQRRMRAFFEALNVHLISPSEVTRDFWSAKADLPHAGVAVAPHMELTWTRRPVKRGPPRHAAVTVAFTGAPVPHKGWTAFEKLVHAHRDTGLFRFVYFGHHDVQLAGVERVPVHVTATNYAAMSEALAAHEVDLVLHWAAWPETFSFTTHEALAAGACVVTNTISGNVAATVRRLNRGAVLEDEDALLDFFGSGRANRLAMESRLARSEYAVATTLSLMTLPFLARENA